MNERRLTYPGWRIAAACGVGGFCTTAALNTFGVFLPALIEQFSWSREAASTAYGSLTIGAALSAPVIGRLIDRCGARPIILCALAVIGSAVTSLAAMTSSLWHFRIVFGVIGLAMMGASPIAYSRVIFGWFDAYRGRALGLTLSSAALSGIVLPPSAAALIRVFDWRTAWLVLGVMTLLMALPVAAAFVRERQPQDFNRSSAAASQTTRDALRSRVLWTLVVVVFGSTAATNAAAVHMVLLLADRGVPLARAAFLLSAMAASSLVGRIVTGWLLDRFAPRRVAIAMLFVAATGAFVLAGAQTMAMGLVAAACLGFGSGGETDVIPYLLSRYFGLRSLSTLYGLNWTAWGLAGAAGPILMGRAFDATGSYTIVLVALGAMTCASAGLMITLPPVPRILANDRVAFS